MKGCGGCHKIGLKTEAEQRLFVMFLEHRTRTFQGAFHANPDYALWYGWSEMQRDLTEIEELAAGMGEKQGKKWGRRGTRRTAAETVEVGGRGTCA